MSNLQLALTKIRPVELSGAIGLSEILIGENKNEDGSGAIAKFEDPNQRFINMVLGGCDKDKPPVETSELEAYLACCFGITNLAHVADFLGPEEFKKFISYLDVQLGVEGSLIASSEDSSFSHMRER